MAEFKNEYKLVDKLIKEKSGNCSELLHYLKCIQYIIQREGLYQALIYVPKLITLLNELKKLFRFSLAHS